MITPVPKTKPANQLKEYRPIAVTSVLSKCFERLVMKHITPLLQDELQFAYQPGRSTDDAVLTLIDKTVQHLDKNAKNYARALFLDFSSVFNTIDPSILTTKLIGRSLHPNLVSWVTSFLTNRTQRVKTSSGISESVSSSIGSPQGCVLSAILFTIYVDDLQTSRNNITIIKYADDTIILELLQKDEASLLQQELEDIFEWCNSNSLILNTSKTKELIISNSRDNPKPSTLSLNGSDIDRVSEYKYLGTIITSKLNFDKHTDHIVCKARRRLYLMNRLAYMKVSESMIKTVYTAFIESQLTYHLAIIYGHLSQHSKKCLESIPKIASKLSNTQHRSISSVYTERMKQKVLKMIQNDNPPIIFNRLPSGRYRSVRSRVSLSSNSFRALAIRLLNDIFY
jgi:hypothetical protein